MHHLLIGKMKFRRLNGYYELQKTMDKMKRYIEFNCFENEKEFE